MSGVVTREMFERGNAVAVLMYDPKADRVVLIRQFLSGAHYAGMPAWPLQIVAGMMDTMLSNNPEPTYVHQTNIMGTPPPGPAIVRRRVCASWARAWFLPLPPSRWTWCSPSCRR